jgi:predicted ArsR family transcriptional regulator
MSDPPRSIDTQLLRCLRGGRSLGIGELTETLGVTATAIRQRLQRLLAAGLVQRRKIVVGRGRPAFEYQLTEQGQRCVGANAAPLAEALWQEVLALADDGPRQQILAGVARRLGRSYAASIAAGQECGELSLSERMQRLGEVLATQHIHAQCGATERSRSAGTDASGELPLLDICDCPYPLLRDATPDRTLCQLEAEIFSEALGMPVELADCVLDGDASCQFVPAKQAEAVTAAP